MLDKCPAAESQPGLYVQTHDPQGVRRRWRTTLRGGFLHPPG